MSKFDIEQRVKVKKTDQPGTVKRILYNPYLPAWLSSPNYLVLIDGEALTRVFTKKELTKA